MGQILRIRVTAGATSEATFQLEFGFGGTKNFEFVRLSGWWEDAGSHPGHVVPPQTFFGPGRLKQLEQ